ncbi:MAG: hypothetical protein V3U54_08415, partial [Thermodesulfobacteriota bacterium]
MRKEARFAFIICSSLMGILLFAVILMSPNKSSETLKKEVSPVKQSTTIKAGNWVTIHDGFWDECFGWVIDKKEF